MRSIIVPQVSIYEHVHVAGREPPTGRPCQVSSPIRGGWHGPHRLLVSQTSYGYAMFYVELFMCTASQAIHLELTTNQSCHIQHGLQVAHGSQGITFIKRSTWTASEQSRSSPET